VRGRAGQTDALRHAADRRDELVDLVPHQKAAVAGLRALAVLDFNRARVLLHLGQGVDDFVPAEIAAGDLQNHVFQKARLEQTGRTAAFAGADADRQAQLFVEVRHAHLQAFPHIGRKSAEGHRADDERINLAHRRHPALLPVDLQHFLRRQHPAQKRAQFELVPSRVERRVGQHRDPDKLDFVEHAVRIVSSAAAPSGLAALVDVKAQLVDFRAARGRDGAVGTDERAHAAAHAGMRRIGALINAVVHGKHVAGPALQADRRRKRALAVHAQINRPDGTDGRAASAQRAPVPVPQNLPGQISDA